jgi:hypothetical protein
MHRIEQHKPASVPGTDQYIETRSSRIHPTVITASAAHAYNPTARAAKLPMPGFVVIFAARSMKKQKIPMLENSPQTSAIAKRVPLLRF